MTSMEPSKVYEGKRLTGGTSRSRTLAAGPSKEICEQWMIALAQRLSVIATDGGISEDVDLDKFHVLWTGIGGLGDPFSGSTRTMAQTLLACVEAATESEDPSSGPSELSDLYSTCGFTKAWAAEYRERLRVADKLIVPKTGKSRNQATLADVLPNAVAVDCSLPTVFGQDGDFSGATIGEMPVKRPKKFGCLGDFWLWVATVAPEQSWVKLHDDRLGYSRDVTFTATGESVKKTIKGRVLMVPSSAAFIAWVRGAMLRDKGQTIGNYAYRRNLKFKVSESGKATFGSGLRCGTTKIPSSMSVGLMTAMYGYSLANCHTLINDLKTSSRTVEIVRFASPEKLRARETGLSIGDKQTLQIISRAIGSDNDAARAELKKRLCSDKYNTAAVLEQAIKMFG